jgi:stearoyl-CoA desaturase (Delta-9 desaturase)
MGETTGLLKRFVLWFDTYAADKSTMTDKSHVDWFRVIPFIAVHLACLAVIWVGWSAAAVGVAVGLFVVRMFAITGFYHRYFSHRSFSTSRVAQFVFAILGAAAAQRGPLWWAAHHRNHHKFADTELDVHSPRQQGFWWAHMGWITAPGNFPTDLDRVKDLKRYPELIFLDRFDILVPFLLAFSLFLLGGWQFVVWGFFVSTVVLFHATCLINSLAHMIGRRRFDTNDDSRNSLLLALITFGEGWHNNHHKHPGSTRMGLYWWEIDLTFYMLWVLEKFRIIWDLHPTPSRTAAAT